MPFKPESPKEVLSSENRKLPKPPGNLAFAEFTLKGLVVLPHVRVVLPFLGKLQITDVAFPECEFVNNQV